MPKFKSQKFAVLMDMAGCPNRCRHCWLGNPPNRRVPEEILRWVVKQFRDWTGSEKQQAFKNLFTVMTWYREPDFAPNYRELWELEKELSDSGAAIRFELLSLWRLAREKDYAQWARDIGTDICQISFFGLEETTDFFTRRRGSFRDNLLATVRLLEVGIRPRWQLFLTKSVVPDLESFVELIHKMDLERRVHALGHEFEVFVHPVAPDGAAFDIEHFRPTVDVLASIPSYLAEKTKDYHNASSLEECLGKAEKDWILELLREDEPFAMVPPTLAFMVTPELDVFSNIGEPMPWWKLGNLQMDGVDRIMQCFENDEVPGLHVNFHIPVSALAQQYGCTDSPYIYTREDLILRWLRQWGEEHWKRRIDSQPQ